MALSSSGLDIRLLDMEGKALSMDEDEIPGGIFGDWVWEQTLSTADSFEAGNYYLVVVANPGENGVPYLFTAQFIKDGLVAGRIEATGQIEAGAIQRFPLMIETNEDGEITIRLGNAIRKIEGAIER